MVARPGRLQSAFTAGELAPELHERTSLKYFGTGADRMENVVPIPQGGFTLADGLLHVGDLTADAARLIPFTASTGAHYDVVLRVGSIRVWSATAELQSVALTALTAPILPDVTVAQLRDTMLLFHPDMQTRRLKHAGPTSWSVDLAPYENVFNYDYGGPIGGGSYTNGVAAVWEIEFIGLNTSSVFTLVISGQRTVAVDYDADMTVLAGRVQAAVLDLPNTAPGITCVSTSGGAGGRKVTLTFAGADNLGDQWAVSGDVANKADAAVLPSKTVTGVEPGEPLFSTARGWPSCGAFYQQRLLIGGFKGVPNGWAFSVTGDYYNFNTKFTEADGPALIPMDTGGGENVERLVAGRNLLVFTSQAEYWLAERKISRTEAPNHVKSSTHGSRRGAPIVESEGAAIFCQQAGGVLAEFRYTDLEGNYVSQDISVLASHLVRNVSDMAVRKSTASSDGNVLHAVSRDDGTLALVTMLRAQEVTAFSRRTTPSGAFRACSVNGRNEAMFLIDRPSSRTLERGVPDLLLDEARAINAPGGTTSLTGLSRFNGRVVWVVADNHVLGPFTVSGGAVTLPIAVTAGHVGTWAPPVVTTLPPPRDIGPNIVLKRKARLHSAQISVLNTTSIAVSVNGGPPQDINLMAYGATADVPELARGVTGTLRLRGLRGYRDEPKLTITQIRPGRLTVRAVTLEVDL